MNIEELHKKILYPVVRIRTEKAGGSGSVIYSKPNPKNPEEYQSFVMTCEHVINDAIIVKEKEWDSSAKKKIDKEYLSQVIVELFDYVYLSKVNSANAIKADIVAYDKEHDIAILKLDSPKKVENVATIIPKEKIKDNKGLILAESFVQVKNAKKMSDFSISLTYKKPSTQKGIVEVFQVAAKDGSEINKIIIPIVFKD